MNLHKRLLSLMLCAAVSLSFVLPAHAEALSPSMEDEMAAAFGEYYEEIAQEFPWYFQDSYEGNENSYESYEEFQSPATRGELNITKITLDVGERTNLFLNGASADEFESSAEEVATVSDDGEVVACGAGTTKITVTDTNNQKYSCTVEVDGVLTKDDVTIAEGKTAKINLKGASISSVKSSNTSVATVSSDGRITACKNGNCTITVVDSVGNRYTCHVTVTSSYLNRVASNAKYVYGLIEKLHCRHAIGTTSLAELKQKKKVTCNSSASVALQLSGILPTGKTMGHTPSKGGNPVQRKNTVSKAIKKKNLLKSGTYTIVRAGTTFSKLPAKYKQAGMVYIQDSNMCISAGNGYVYSCNQSSNEMKAGRYYKTRVNTGYPFSHAILYIIVPKG